MILDGFLMPKWEALRSKNKHFALYLLQFKRSRWIMKFDEKCNAKGHRISFKIRAAGAQGLDFSDLGTVSIFHFTFCRISLSLWAHRDPTGTHRDPPGTHRDPPGTHQGISGSSGRQLRARTRGTSGRNIEYLDI